MYENREGRIYVGANDGMLHSFDKDLNLRWSFIPPQILSKLRGLKGSDPSGKTNGTSNSKFLVDGPIVVKDVYDPGDKKWITILVGALGYGGKGYYVLDISHHEAPFFLGAVENDDKNNRVLRWNKGGEMQVHRYGAGSTPMALTDLNYPYQYLGFTLSKPSIVLLPYVQKAPPAGRWSYRYGFATQQRHALVFGAGYAGGMTTNQGNYVIVSDALRRKIDGMIYGTPSPDGQRYNNYGPFDALAWTKVPKDAASDANKGVTAGISIVIPDKLGDAESDYYGGIAYFPDLHGQLWKFNLSRKTLPPADVDYSSTGAEKTADSSNGDSSMHQLNKLWRSETTVANDRFGSHQVATTLVDSGAGKYIYNYFGTGDQTHVQTRYTTIDNRIIGARDIDFPAPTTTLSGTDKIASSEGIHKVDLGGAGSSCSSIGAPGWYGNLNDKFANAMPRATGRILIKNKNLYIPVYWPENTSCPAYGQSTIMVMTNGCSGSITTINTGTGISTSAVSDSEGNVYIGLSNQEERIRVADSASRVGNIVKLGKAILPEEEEEVVSPTPGIRIKSWRELFNY
jgi:Tfp pilus tip-associated adhesin PilY1